MGQLDPDECTNLKEAGRYLRQGLKGRDNLPATQPPAGALSPKVGRCLPPSIATSYNNYYSMALGLLRTQSRDNRIGELY
jgi:hypothetical protein